MEVKYCPTCKVIQKTTCCACGCGNCTVCDYRWFCMLPVEYTRDKIDKLLTILRPI